MPRASKTTASAAQDPQRALTSQTSPPVQKLEKTAPRQKYAGLRRGNLLRPKDGARRQASENGIAMADLLIGIEKWITAAKSANHSKKTIDQKEYIAEKFLWWLNREGITLISKETLAQFFIYLRETPKEPRWGAVNQPRAMLPLSSDMLSGYWRFLHALFAFLLERGDIREMPLDKAYKPIVRKKQIQPFTQAHIEAMLEVTVSGYYSRRDRAMILVLYDTGIRCGELCALSLRDLDLKRQSILVRNGKGGKSRQLFFGEKCRDALRDYLAGGERKESAPIFLSDSNRHGGRFTGSGIFQIIQRTAQYAEIKGVRCSPHTLRHTFALEFLRAKNSVYALKEAMGHSSLYQSLRYLALSDADVEVAMKNTAASGRLDAPKEVGRKKRAADII